MPKKRKSSKKSSKGNNGGIIGALENIGKENSISKGAKRSKKNENNPWNLKPIL